MLVSNNGGYKMFCETKLVKLSNDDMYSVHLYTEYEHAKDPSSKQTKLLLNLTQKEYDSLVSALTKITD